MRLLSRNALSLAAVGAAVAVVVSVTPAAADSNAPAINYWKGPVPIIGTTLSNSSSSASFAIKDGWTVYDPDGICSAYTQLYNGSWQTIWSQNGGTSVKNMASKHQWSVTVGGWTEFRTNATDCFSNSGWAYAYVEPSLYQEGSASYSAGWSSGACTCWSAGSVFKSTKVGATASFTFNGSIVSLVTDKGPSRGSASLYIDGVFKKTVSFTKTGSNVNRVIVWNSPYLSTSGSHVLTVKVASGRVDIDGFIVNY